MFKKSIKLSILSVLVLGGCTTFQTRPLKNQSDTILRDSSTNSQKVEQSIVNILGGQWEPKKHFGDNIAKTLKTFKNDSSLNNLRSRRNEMQDYLKAIADQNCINFKSDALFMQSTTGFGLNAASTILATAGTLLNPESTAKALAGASGALNGINSQVNESFYREKTLEVITKAINIRRKELWANIERRRQDDKADTTTSYTATRAIADVIEYNNACSLIEGFEMLDLSVAQQEERVDKAVDVVTNSQPPSGGGGAESVLTSPRSSNSPKTVAAALARE